MTVDVRGPRDLTGSGSGIILDTDGLVVTNAHVVSEATLVSVTLADGSEIAADVVGMDVANDVAVLVVYLASQAADHINGCVFEVYNGHVGIFQEPPPVKQVLWKEGSFTPEELADIIPQTLTRGESREEFPNTLPFKLDMREMNNKRD